MSIWGTSPGIFSEFLNIGLDRGVICSYILKRRQVKECAMAELTRFEEQILLSVWKLKDEAYGISIYQHIRDLTGRKMAIGGIYFPLERLVKKGFLSAQKGEPTPVRGGQSKRYYCLTETGVEELIRSKKIQDSFWKELPPLEFAMREMP